MLNEMIQVYRTQVAATPSQAPDEVMDAIITAQCSVLISIKDAPCSNTQDAISKLRFAVELIEQAYSEGSHPVIECELLEHVLLDIVDLRNHRHN